MTIVVVLFFKSSIVVMDCDGVLDVKSSCEAVDECVSKRLVAVLVLRRTVLNVIFSEGSGVDGFLEEVLATFSVVVE